MQAGKIAMFFLLAAASTAFAEPQKTPNFLFIMADDMGYSDAGCYGGDVQTPNLDRLADGGLRFTQMYSTARCWPSRSCLMTGYYAQQVRMDPKKGHIPAWTRCVPNYLKPAGYRCYHSGKWHVDCKIISEAGFDRSYCINDHDRFFNPQHATLDDEQLPPVPEGTDFYLTTAIADYMLGFLKQHSEKHANEPFFSYLAFTSPHFPLHAKKEDIDRYRDKYREGWDVMRQRRFDRMRSMGLVQGELPPREPNIVASWSLSEEKLQAEIGPGESGRAVAWNELTDAQRDLQATKMAIHAAMIDRMDQEVGRVLDQLKAMKVLDNTVVVFLSDNGASAEQIIRGDRHDQNAPLGSAKSYLCLGPGWSTAANTPFRYHKSFVHEGGISSPAIVSWPAGISGRGQLRHTPAHFIDWLPTVLELAGVTPAGDWNGKTPPPLPGRSLVKAFDRDETIARECLFWHHMSNRAIRVGDWKLVSAGGKGPDGDWELYNMKNDRSETKNLAAVHPEKVKELAELWNKHEKEFDQQAGPAEKAKPKGKVKK